MIHCERCGREVPSTEVAYVRYCLDCNVYVCLACWDAPRSRCRTCAPPTGSRLARGARLRTARRADRRLREGRTEASALAASPVGAPAAWVQLTCLTIKVAVAEQLGTRALNRLTGATAVRARPLADRMRRNALAAVAALEGADASLTGVELRREPVARTVAPATGATRSIAIGETTPQWPSTPDAPLGVIHPLRAVDRRPTPSEYRAILAARLARRAAAEGRSEHPAPVISPSLREPVKGRPTATLAADESPPPSKEPREHLPSYAVWIVAIGVIGLFAALWGSGLLNSPDAEVGAHASPREDELAGEPAGELPASTASSSKRSAGSNNSATPAAFESTSPARFTIDHQFDDLPIGSALNAEWSVTGSQDNVVVAAYPTAINRSLQMQGGPDDLQLCRVGAPGSGASSVAVEFLFDLAVPPDARLLHLRAATGDVELVTTEESGLVLNLLGQSLRLSQVEPMRWYRVMLQAEDGVLLASLFDAESGAVISQGSVDHSFELSAEAVCFELPAGATSDLYVDELTITT